MLRLAQAADKIPSALRVPVRKTFEIIGSGGFGTVYRGVAMGGLDCAVKVPQAFIQMPSEKKTRMVSASSIK
jgi:hypothetical protein